MSKHLGRRPRVVIVGGGAGGLAAAVDCSRRGAEVVVLERGTCPGGKIRQERIEGRAIDAGPTVLTMRWVFDALFEAAGARLDEHVQLRALDVLARHAWADGSRLDLLRDREAAAAEIARFAGPADADGYLRFCRHTETIYQKVQGPFIREARPTVASLFGSLGLRGLPRVLDIDFHRTMWKALGEFFGDPRLRQLFARYATYYGSDPYTAPATLNLIAHVEQAGVWAPVGGMAALAGAVAGLAGALGAEIRYGAEVAAIEVAAGHVQGVRLTGGERIGADAIIFNGDVAALAEGRLGGGVAGAVKPPARERRSLSAVTWCLLAEVRGFPLVYHNVLFSRDYADEFQRLGRGELPREPTVYVCAPDRLGGEPAGAERLMVLVNAPPRGDEGRPSAREIEQCQAATFQQFERCGLTVTPASAAVVTTPDEFARRFPGTGGGLYGSATRGWTDALSRLTARTRVRGLYLAGGSVHPGAGVPMATLSGRFAASSACEDLASTGLSLRAGTSGGTSTRSPTTAATG